MASAAMPRDPRVDPQAGDVLRGKCSERIVLKRPAKGIVYFHTTGIGKWKTHPYPESSLSALSSWKKWAERSAVLARVGERTGELVKVGHDEEF